MKVYIFYFILFYLFIQANLRLSPEKSEELLKKYTKKITEDGLQYIKPQTKGSMTLNYTVEEINKTLEKYGFPHEYDFFNETGCEKVVKNQGRCGSCWSFGSTTSLAYRYCQQLGMDIDLSPQDAVSCYIKDCMKGNYLIDSQLNLIKNGTVTESCFPYTSGENATVEECISECKNENEEFKKYYAQNAYMTEDYLSQETHLDIIALIIDQLINNGPVVTAFTVFNDLYYLNKSICEADDYIYTYDEESPSVGGHIVAIVGYGYLNGKYYWLIQNSWGKNWCDNGFIKMEFGQAGIENVAILEPYIHRNTTEKKEIEIVSLELDDWCKMSVGINTNYSDWKDTLEIRFSNDERFNNFTYQCSKNNITGKGEISKCYFEYWNLNSYRGNYTLQDYQSLGDDNIFILDKQFENKKVYNYGYNYIYTLITEYYFVSEEGSRILMNFVPNNPNEETIIPNIYADWNVNKTLSNCQPIEGFSYMYCDITKEELNYFEEFSWDGNRTDKDLIYDILCGDKDITNVVIYRLNKEKYPVLRVKDFKFERVDEISNSTWFTLVADVEGNKEACKEGTNYFINNINIETEGENKTFTIYCLIKNTSITENAANIKCGYLEIDYTIKYDNVYLLPFYLPYDYTYPTELIIKDTIKATIIEPTPEEEEQEEEQVEPEEEEEQVEPEEEEEEKVEPEEEEEEKVEPEEEEEEQVEPEEEEEEQVKPEEEEEEKEAPEREEEEKEEPGEEEEQEAPEEEEEEKEEPGEEEEEQETPEREEEEKEEPGEDEEEQVEPEKEEEEDGNDQQPSGKSSSNTTKILIIVFSVVGGIIVVVIIVFLIIRFLGKKKITTEDIEKDTTSNRKLLDSNELKE